MTVGLCERMGGLVDRFVFVCVHAHAHVFMHVCVCVCVCVHQVSVHIRTNFVEVLR